MGKRTMQPAPKTELAPRPSAPIDSGPFMSKENWDLAITQAGMLVQSGMLPVHIKTPAQFMAIVVRGRELGLAPMESVAHLFLVQGKVSLDVQTQLGIIYRRLPGAKVDIAESTDTAAKVIASRPGGQPQEFTFTAADAQRAGLHLKDTWKRYPRIMILWRALAQAARTVFPDVLAGVYAPGELPQDNRVIEVEGKVIDADPMADAPWNKGADGQPAPPAPATLKIERVNEETGEITEEPAPAAPPARAAVPARKGKAAVADGLDF